MGDYEKALAEFMAKQAPQVIPPVTNQAESKIVRRASWTAQKERERIARKGNKQ